MGEDFNNLKAWMTGKLAERKMNTHRFSQMTGDRISAVSIYRWYSGKFRPTDEKMLIVCETLSRLPIIEEGKPDRFEHVPLYEGMAQFSETQRSDRLRRR
jgi:hypothetical protein